MRWPRCSSRVERGRYPCISPYSFPKGLQGLCGSGLAPRSRATPVRYTASPASRVYPRRGQHWHYKKLAHTITAAPAHPPHSQHLEGLPHGQGLTRPPRQTRLDRRHHTCLESEVKGKHLFRVEPGNCADHALQQASELLNSARRASFIGVMDDEPVLVWAAHYLSEMAKALMDDAHRGMHKRD
ncbi:DUF3077 domain-containing protein [Pseudomonas sp. S44]|uniref:DUF3077 domain-containing protein n=1 Tax=Pseudomonas sp. S44 TaxID=2767450 RepID=UPI002D7F88E7|nr:DUF3077 domain-containing protein [Pseudomonas sp. S44]